MLLPHLRGQQRAAGDRVGTEMRNIHYHFTNTIHIYIRWLDGTLVPTAGASLPIFDDKHSFLIAINSAEMSITAESMTHVLNDYVFARADAPLKKIVISTDGGRLKVKGVLHKGDLPFEMEGTIAATQDGKVRIHAEKIKAAHLPAKGLLDLLGIEISSLLGKQKVRGVRAEGDDLVLDPELILPPPQIQGRVKRVRIEGDRIVHVFGSGKPPVRPAPGNYMAFRGGLLRFGKLTMSDADMVLIDLDARDPFDFDLDHYREQLTAGHTKITPQFGLRVFMPDYEKLQRRPRAPAVRR